MTDSFLLVVAPWILFGVGVTLLCLRLLGPRLLRLRGRRGGRR
jgi:hypothetical protein